jgi:hypothetical protein
MVIAENIAGGDGLVDNPDDEHDGGTITLSFGVPYKLLSLKAFDHERPDELIETPSTVQIDNVGEECDPPASLGGVTGCRDDCTLIECGDGILDPGEQCDPPLEEICDNMMDDDGTFSPIAKTPTARMRSKR